MVVCLVWDVQPQFTGEKCRSAANVVTARFKVFFKCWNNVILAGPAMFYVGFQVFRARFDIVPRRAWSGNLECMFAEAAEGRR